MCSKHNKQKYNLYEYKPLKYDVINSRTLQQLLTFFFQHISIRFIAIAFDTSNMLSSFSPLSTQITNSCFSSLSYQLVVLMPRYPLSLDQ